MEIRKAGIPEISQVATLSLKLWPDHTLDEMIAEFDLFAQRNDAALFLAYDGEKAIGFAQCQLRHDYVEGTSSSPVGYLEGIYVRASDRHLGFAGQLMQACEDWARGQHCTEFASDCQIDHTESLSFHLKMGFKEANRIICFAKHL